MTIKIPMRIAGAWQEGYVLDYHTIRSEFLGYDEFGKERFNTTRTELGEMLYRLKYRSDSSVLSQLANRAAEFIRKWSPAVDGIVPAPATRVRQIQPVVELAKAVGGLLNLTVLENIIQKAKNTKQLKDIADYNERIMLLQDAYRVSEGEPQGRSVLLLDDLYSSGATLNAVTQALLREGHCSAVYVLALTRTGTAS